MKRWYARVLLALFVGILGAAIYLTPQGAGLEEQFGLQWLFHARGNQSAPAEVIVVSLDQASASHLDLPLRPALWPRTLHAHLVEQLSRAGAAVIAFDLAFDQPSQVAEQDAQFAAAIEQARNVVLVERLDFDEIMLADEKAGQPAAMILQEWAGEIVPVLAHAARAQASFPLPKSAWVSQSWTFRPSAGDMPTLPAVVLQLFALPAYGSFLRLLTEMNPALGRQLPPDAQAVEMEELILDLRQAFLHDPLLGPLMLDKAARHPDLSAAYRRMIHALVNLYAGSEIRHLNFYGPPRTIKTIPYHQLVECGHDNQFAMSDGFDFSGKIVLVGFSAATAAEQDKIRDDYHTVFSRADGLTLSGVEIAATAVANLLEDEALQPLPPLSGALILCLYGSLACLLGFLVPVEHARAALAVVMLVGIWTVIYSGSAIVLFSAKHVWLPLAIPMLIQLPMGMIGVSALRYFEANRERKRIEALFGRHRPWQVVQDVVNGAGPIHAESQLVYGVCLATDAEKYTTLAETMDPRQLALLMHDYYASLFEPVERLGGKVSDVIGDAMLAIWAAAVPDQALRKQACLACLDIVAAIDHFNQSNHHPPLPTRLGLHFGEMLLGNVGARQHYEYRAVGDIVNTANRIQGVNKFLGTRLLVSEEVVMGLEDFLLRPLGWFILPGKSQAINLQELVAHREASHEAQQRLCEKFRQALLVYASGDLKAACRQFQMIRNDFPEDGPTQFYLRHCQASLQRPPSQSWQPTIRMQLK